jgi:hypothetical protein
MGNLRYFKPIFLLAPLQAYREKYSRLTQVVHSLRFVQRKLANADAAVRNPVVTDLRTIYRNELCSLATKAAGRYLRRHIHERKLVSVAQNLLPSPLSVSFLPLIFFHKDFTTTC